MKKLVRISFLTVALVWLHFGYLAILQAYPFASFQCGPGWGNGDSGFYCSPQPGDAEGWCIDNQQGYENQCADVCDACGGLASTGFRSCSFQRVDQPGAPYCPTAQWYQKWTLSCWCEISCEDSCFGDNECICECSGLTYDAGHMTCVSSPILINLDSVGLNDHLTSPEDGVVFDIGGRGVPAHVSWPRAGSQVGFLARDLDGNGRIDNGEELFGNATVTRSGVRAANGFDALRDLDENGDGKITASDHVFSSLVLWIDRNHNGISEPSELRTLSELQIVAISTEYRERKHVDHYGNQYRFEGDIVMANSQKRRIFDVFLVAIPVK